MIVTEASRYSGEIQVTAEAGDCNLRSLLALVELGLEEGTPIRIRVTGPDEEKTCQRLVELFETCFDFPPLSPEGRARVRGILLSDI